MLVKGKYLSGKQKEFIEKEYETLLKKRNEVTIAISNGYEFKEYLKEDGYSFNPRKKEWSKTVPSRYADDEQEKLKAIGIDSSSVQRRKATW